MGDKVMVVRAAVAELISEGVEVWRLAGGVEGEVAVGVVLKAVGGEAAKLASQRTDMTPANKNITSDVTAILDAQRSLAGSCSVPRSHLQCDESLGVCCLKDWNQHTASTPLTPSTTPSTLLSSRAVFSYT